MYGYLFISGLVLGGERLVLALVGARLPASAELLGNVTDRVARVSSLHLGSLVVTETEERRPNATQTIFQPLFQCTIHHQPYLSHSLCIEQNTLK